MGRAILSRRRLGRPPDAGRVAGDFVKSFTSLTIQSGAKGRHRVGPLCKRFRNDAATLRHMGPPRGTGKGGTDPQVDVRLDRVTKRFGSVVAVDGISLEIRKGEFFSLLGPSGCGKTTTLRMIGGFELPDEGVIELGGANVAGLPPHRRNVNTVFQSYALFPHLNVFENVAYGLRRKRIAKDHVPGQVR